MSENVGAIEYTCSIELEGFLRDKARLQREMADVEKSGDKLAATMTAVGKAVAGLIAAAQIGAAMTAAVNATRRYEKALMDLSAITGATGDALKSIDDAAKSMARSTTASAGEAVEAMKLIASAKPELLESKGALEAVTQEAIRLAEASGMALPAAAENLTIALNQFQESAGGAARFVDVLAAGAKYGASEIGETSIALKNAAVSAKAAGLSFEETNAAIQTLAASGIKGGEAGTALRNVLLKLETETTGATRPSVDGLASALDALSGKNMSAAELTKLFGLENVNAAQAMLRSTEQMKLLTSQLTGTNTATEQAATNTKTLDAEIKRMNNALDLAAQKLGSDLAPAVTQVVGGIKTLALMFADGSIASTKLADAGVVLAGALSGIVLTALYRYAAGVVAATTATAAFNGALAVMGGPIGLAITALGLLALNWDKVSGAADNAANLVERSAGRIQAALKMTGEAQTNNLRGLKSELKQQLLKAEKDAGTTTSLYGGKRDQKFIDADLAKVDALKKAIADVDAAMASRENYGNEDRRTAGPAAPPPPPKSGGSSGGSARTKAEPRDFLGQMEEGFARRVSDYGDRNQNAMDRADEKAAQDKAREDERKAQEQARGQQQATGFVNQAIGAVSSPEDSIENKYAADLAKLEEFNAKKLLTEQQYADAQFAIAELRDRKVADLAAQREAAERQKTSMMLQGASQGFGAMADIIGTFAGKQSGAYKAMFAVSKAFAIADAVMSISQGAAKAWSLGFPMGIPAAATVMAQGAGLISQIKGTSYGGGRQFGGPVSAGSMYRVNETGRPEMFTSNTGAQYMLPTANGSVTPANKVGGGGASGGGAQQAAPNVTLSPVFQGVQMPDGWFAVRPEVVADALKVAYRDGHLAGFRG